MELVTVTSQGQISIPAKLRRKYGLKKNKKILVKESGDKIILETVPDIFSMKGAFKHKTKEARDTQKTIEVEEKAWEVAATQRYDKSLKSKKLYVV